MARERTTETSRAPSSIKSLAFLERVVPRPVSRTVLLAAGVMMLLYGYQNLLPVFRLGYRSELAMLGDLNGDQRWNRSDVNWLRKLLVDPFSHTPRECLKADLNQDGRLDAEDAAIMEHLAASEDAYASETKALNANLPFPRPRELYRYLSPREYLNRPLYALPYPGSTNSVLKCLSKPKAPLQSSPYTQQLWAEVQNEAIRFDLAYRARFPRLTELESTYAKTRIILCNQLHDQERYYELLLELIGLVEDAETLTTRGQEPFVFTTWFQWTRTSFGGSGKLIVALFCSGPCALVL